MATLTMAHTLSTSSSSSPDPELFTPPPSHTTLQQVPDVFVIPPEEEHHENPPFCYYDAAMESKKSLSIEPDMDALDAALGMCQQTDNRAPVFHRHMNESQETIVMPKRSDGRDILSSAETTPPRRRVLDDDVVEVVKVSRNDGVSNTPVDVRKDTLKKSTTFRARASQAFRSIKNVGKGSRKAVPDGWGAPAGIEPDMRVASTEEVHPPSMSKMARKPSNLKQIFASSNVKHATPDVPASPTSPTSSSEWSALSRPSMAVEDMSAPFPTTAGLESGPSLSGKRSFVRRISVLDIQRLFTLSNPSKPDSPSMLKENMTPSASRSSSKRESIMSSRTTASTGLSSIEDIFGGVSASPRPHSFHGGASQSQGTLSALPSPGPETEAQNASFELHLDSLHFDSLHFDPDEFVLHLQSDS
ncbi:hypothetical protein BC835DRAFT_731245 [Cytidiella melzeri]|nr:hypothetical protein BC835DRAFT_731245 [Cytidiella melzeri]